MRKRIGVKLAVTIAAVCAMTLLQGCEGEADNSVVASAWTPVGYPWIMFNYLGFYQGSVGGGDQSTTSSSSGGASVSAAISSAAGGGGGQVSAGGSF